MDLSTAIEQFFGDVQLAAQTIAPLIAVIGFIGLGVMYMGSSWPIIGDWKKDNPKAANQVVVGLLFVIFASSVHHPHLVRLALCAGYGALFGALYFARPGGPMAADFKSHVLLRDEKGLFGIPFKRLLLAGVGGGMTYTIFNLAVPGWSIPVAVVTVLLIIILTGLRGGIPLWQRLIYRLRGSLLLIAARYPRSPIGQLTEMLDMPVELVRLDGARVFAPPTPNVDLDLREWITFAHAQEADGLVFVDSPLKEGLHE